MSIEQKPNRQPLISPLSPPWGELTPESKLTRIVRFVLPDRVISVRAPVLKRWEHVAGEPETLTIQAGKELIVVEGRELNAVRAALDLDRLGELRTNGDRSKACPGPQVRRITIEPT